MQIMHNLNMIRQYNAELILSSNRHWSTTLCLRLNGQRTLQAPSRHVSIYLLTYTASYTVTLEPSSTPSY